MNNKYLYWTEEHLWKMSKVETFEDVRDISKSVLFTIPKPVFGVSFPLTTGGYGLEKNKKIIESCILKLTSFGYNIFNFLPLEMGLKPLKVKWERNVGGYCKPILEIVYKGLFETKIFELIFSSPDWESSVGAKGENEILQELKIPVLKIPKSLYKEILIDAGIKDFSKVVST